MKRLIILILALITTGFADPQHTFEIVFNLINTGSSWNVTITAEQQSVRWNEYYNLTTKYQGGSISLESPNETFAGFDHILDPSGNDDTLAIGKYKISVLGGDAYFYLDLRTSDWNGSLDVYFKYDVANDRFRNNDNTETINGTTQNIWDPGLETELQHITTDLEPPAPDYIDAYFYYNELWVEFDIPSDTYATEFDIYRSTTSWKFGYSYIATTENNYYIDNDLVSGSGYTAYYKVKAINGSKVSDYSDYTSIVFGGFQKTPNKEQYFDFTDNLSFELKQNFPNPFNPQTEISYSLKERSSISLKVFDITGKEVVSLTNGIKDAGLFSKTFNGVGLPSGLYIYELDVIGLESGQRFKDTKRMLLIK
jgi:Secretion system C-terminal sorting domain